MGFSEINRMFQYKWLEENLKKINIKKSKEINGYKTKWPDAFYVRHNEKEWLLRYLQNGVIVSTSEKKTNNYLMHICTLDLLLHIKSVT